MDRKPYKNADKPQTPPEDFPKLILAEDARHSELARNLMWEHSIPYGPKWNEWLHGEDGFPQYPELPAGPKATLWDGWMCAPELWPSIHTDGIHERLKALWKESLLSS